ncbi:hypothetical protein [Microvirga pudoricolor]|uniref:hypothetical protein n=1 Tax=Microvirga pudoricolor TaxID=2778729 RepID=UPI001951C616|nr:hypothetical protein [Microvirga pudoricolor]MBM6593984.1 hypothetical protein [Microvirga pudoricolor]
MAQQPLTDPERESREALERVRRDSETFAASSLGRAGGRLRDHLAARDAIGDAEGGGTDPIELWGRRIGRALSVVGFIALSLWLAHQLGYL